eukprot:GHRQ01014449.1.p2 GENE.GHRQ01014449.1~~GHRQ01014449.1.p2  ORF type:complete len:138 (-),score=16.74 GHRQ01014449.1:654-1067(-)
MQPAASNSAGQAVADRISAAAPPQRPTGQAHVACRTAAGRIPLSSLLAHTRTQPHPTAAARPGFQVPYDTTTACRACCTSSTAPLAAHSAWRRSASTGTGAVSCYVTLHVTCYNRMSSCRSMGRSHSGQVLLRSSQA